MHLCMHDSTSLHNNLYLGKTFLFTVTGLYRIPLKQVLNPYISRDMYLKSGIYKHIHIHIYISSYLSLGFSLQEMGCQWITKWMTLWCQGQTVPQPPKQLLNSHQVESPLKKHHPDPRGVVLSPVHFAVPSWSVDP